MRWLPLILSLLVMNSWSFPCRAASAEPNSTVTFKSKTMIKRCDIDLQYPQFSGQPATAMTQVNAKMKALVDSELNRAKKDFAENTPPPELKNMRGSFYGRYQILLQRPDLISVKLDWTEMPIGAAHPLHWTDVFNYQLTPVKEIILQQLFKPGVNYLKTLSELSTAKLLKDLLPQGGTDKATITDGAKPDAKVFQKFTLGKDSLTIHFAEYQVACYASGPQDVAISYQQLKPLLNPRSAAYLLTTK